MKQGALAESVRAQASGAEGWEFETQLTQTNGLYIAYTKWYLSLASLAHNITRTEEQLTG